MLEGFSEEQIQLIKKELALLEKGKKKNHLFTQVPEYEQYQKIFAPQLLGIPNLSGGNRKDYFLLSLVDNILGLYRQSGRGLQGVICVPPEKIKQYQEVLRELMGAIISIYDRYEAARKENLEDLSNSVIKMEDGRGLSFRKERR